MYLLHQYNVPQGFTLRDTQEDILRLMNSAIEKGYRDIIICAPTGVGKSLVAVTLGRQMGGSHIITSSKNLQEQYLRDFDKFGCMTIKGKSNFKCLDLINEKQQSLFQEDAIMTNADAIKAGLTCEKGICEKPSLGGFNSVKSKKAETIPCQFKPDIYTSGEGDCLYYRQKYEALRHAEHIIWNYASYFSTKKYGMGRIKEYLADRPLVIFDEAHTIEDNITNFAGYDISNNTLQDAGLLEEVSSMKDEYITENIGDIISKISKELTREYTIALSQNNLKKAGKLQAKEKAAAQANALIRQLGKMAGYVSNKPERDKKTNEIKMISCRPVDASPVAGDLLYDDDQKEDSMRVYMSATISRPQICEALGLKTSDVAVIDITKHPFMQAHRPVFHEQVATLKYTSPVDDEIRVRNRIDEILNEHKGERGLILTSSRKRCFDIKNNISLKNSKRITIAHSVGNYNNQTLSEVLDWHKRKDDSVLCSSSLWEGVDLFDDLSRFQILAKCPYPNYAENYTRTKMKVKQNWYQSKTVMRVLQGTGRSVRHADDFAKTYILDGAITSLLKQHKYSMPSAYRDML